MQYASREPGEGPNEGAQIAALAMTFVKRTHF